jgi:hypothetical protein
VTAAAHLFAARNLHVERIGGVWCTWRECSEAPPTEHASRDAAVAFASRLAVAEGVALVVHER